MGLRFRKGEFHGDGALVYPNGGRYVAKSWAYGALISLVPFQTAVFRVVASLFRAVSDHWR